MRSFFPLTIKQWNNLPIEIQQLTHKAFKEHIHQQLGTPDPPEYYTFGSKIGNMLHARLRMNMTHLNHHLFSVNKVDSPECKCGYRKEDVAHFVLQCPEYETQRNVMLDQISLTLNMDFRMINHSMKLEILLYGIGLDGVDGAAAAVSRSFQHFLLTSNRFSNT